MQRTFDDEKEKNEIQMLVKDIQSFDPKDLKFSDYRNRDSTPTQDFLNKYNSTSEFTKKELEKIYRDIYEIIQDP